MTAGIAAAALLAVLVYGSAAEAAAEDVPAKVLGPAQERYLREHVWAVLATGRRDGSPQVSMIAYDYDGRDIAISIKSYTAKWKNVLRQPKVALLVHDGRKQLIVYGRAEPISQDPERLELTKRVMRRLRGSSYVPPDDEQLRASLDQQKRTILRMVPQKAFIND